MYEEFPYSVFALNKYFSLQSLYHVGGSVIDILNTYTDFYKSIPIPPEIIFAIFSVNVRLNIIPLNLPMFVFLPLLDKPYPIHSLLTHCWKNITTPPH